jgi:hypothetical protein
MWLEDRRRDCHKLSGRRPAGMTAVRNGLIPSELRLDLDLNMIDYERAWLYMQLPVAATLALAPYR